MLVLVTGGQLKVNGKWYKKGEVISDGLTLAEIKDLEKAGRVIRFELDEQDDLQPTDKTDLNDEGDNPDLDDLNLENFQLDPNSDPGLNLLLDDGEPQNEDEEGPEKQKKSSKK